MRGENVVAAMKQALNDCRGLTIVRLVCAPDCQRGELCHGDNLAELALELAADRDRRAREQHGAAGPKPPPAKKPRKTRSDKGVRKGPTGPRRLKGVGAHRMGHLSLLRFRHGYERQVSPRPPGRP